jgi:hypothetical protein
METAGLEGAQATKLESSEEAPTLHFPKRTNHQPMEIGDAPTSWHDSNLGNGNDDGVTRWGWRWRRCDRVGDGAARRVGNDDGDTATGLAMVRHRGRR